MIQIWLVSMVQHVHNVCTTDACRIVRPHCRNRGFSAPPRARSPAFSSTLSYRSESRPFGQVFTQAGSCPTTTRSTHSVHLSNAVVFRVEARNVERTARNAITAANALLGLEVDDTVGILNHATSAGHAFRQPGSDQCVQPSSGWAISIYHSAPLPRSASPSTIWYLNHWGCRHPQCYCRRYRECRSTLNTPPDRLYSRYRW